MNIIMIILHHIYMVQYFICNKMLHQVTDFHFSWICVKTQHYWLSMLEDLSSIFNVWT